MILFTLLLRLCPRAFREAFGEACAASSRTSVSPRGRAVCARAGAMWMRTVAGIASAAWRERRDHGGTVRARLPFMETVATDLRLTIRMLLGRPLFTAIVVAALSIGVGGIATIFSGLNALVLRPLPGVTGGDRLVLIDRRAPDFSEGVSASVRFYQHLREHSAWLSGIAVWSRVPLTIVVGQDAYGLSGSIVSGN